MSYVRQFAEKFQAALDAENLHVPYPLALEMLRDAQTDPRTDEELIQNYVNTIYLLPWTLKTQAHPATSLTAWFRDFAPESRFGHVGIPFPLPDRYRFRHTWMIAPPDAGKTTALENLIADDLPKVMRGEASVFVMDSQNRLIPSLAKLAAFGPGGPLEGKLVYLEPSEEYPLALNIFDKKNGNAELMEFVLKGLIGAELTSKQGGLFRYLVEAMTAIPDATLRTLKDLLAPDGYDEYRKYIIKIDDEYVVDFFEKRFNQKDFNATKGEIFWRLDAVLSNKLFRRIFSHPRNKLNLFDELNSSKVILVNSNKKLLGGGLEGFGRFFIALLLHATEQRRESHHKLPVFVYIDEASEYIANDENIEEMFDRARKQNISLTIAHQRMEQIDNAKVRDALANAGIIMAGKNKTDAAYLAKHLLTEPHTIINQPTGSFSTLVTDVVTRAITVSFPPSPLDHKAQYMSDEQFAAMRKEMRERYGEPRVAYSKEEEIIDVEFEEVDDQKPQQWE